MAAEGQQHPIGIYLWVWLALFVVSALSYYVDWAGFQGALRWSLILFFMFVKAGAIVWVFMHMKWERLACLLYTSPSPRDVEESRMPSSA